MITFTLPVFSGRVLWRTSARLLVCSSARLLGSEEAVCRTFAIEVRMQISEPAAALGKLYFTPIAALPWARV
jgi:BASS family bile acid:Na+ symporter